MNSPRGQKPLHSTVANEIQFSELLKLLRPVGGRGGGNFGEKYKNSNREVVKKKKGER